MKRYPPIPSNKTNPVATKGHSRGEPLRASGLGGVAGGVVEMTGAGAGGTTTGAGGGGAGAFAGRTGMAAAEAESGMGFGVTSGAGAGRET